MIGKIRKGADFAGLANYLTRNDRGEVLDMHNLSSITPAEAVSEMQVAASVSARTKAPVMHIMVSYSVEEAPTRAQMRADAGEVLAGLGLDQNQAVVVRHNDASHQHLHIMVSRVGADGKAVNDSHSFAKPEATLRRIEERRGWKVTQGRLAPGLDGARMTGARTTRDPHQFTAPPGVKQALLTSRS